MEMKEDLRVVRTRKLLSATLLNMMEEYSLEKISVIDLCSQAMVNRATFYAHFEDKYHLLTFALEELKDEVYSNFSGELSFQSPKELFRMLSHIALDFVTNKKLHVANILKFNRNEKVIETIKDSLIQSVKYQLGKLKDTHSINAPITLSSLCFTGALVDLCIWYIDNPDKYSKEEFEGYINTIIDQLR